MKKYAFIDRDGTIIKEPADYQIDSLEKLQLIPFVIPSLIALQQSGYHLIMVSNQDALGSKQFPQQSFDIAHQALMDILTSQGILFDEILICPHHPDDNCDCRKPKVGLVLPYLQDTSWDRDDSVVIGDRQSDMVLADNMGIKGILISNTTTWQMIIDEVVNKPRQATVNRSTKETDISVAINLDATAPIHIQTGVGFFDHMLEQIGKHGGLSLEITTKGDLHIDDHHTIEDTALALGEAIKKALGDKRGIGRYGFVLPMDESIAQCVLDLSGRAYFSFKAYFSDEKVGDMHTQMVEHFFKSLSDTMQATLHLSVEGDNDHHKVEGLFKAFARALRVSIAKVDNELPSSKGVL